MPPYKGNKGNLMQHWTLCEVLRIAQCHHSALNYFDAHAMAPLATCRTGYDAAFDSVRSGLPKGESAYEKAWYGLTKTKEGYPNSAKFVKHIWEGRYSLFLCEKDPATYACVNDWLGKLNDRNCVCATSRCGDWRCAFAQGLPSPADASLPDDALTVVSFDPYMISTRANRYKTNPGVMYPQDLRRTTGALQGFLGGILAQLSTYSNNGPTSQESVIALVDAEFNQVALKRVATVQVNESMMSLIYARDVPWASGELAHLGDGFTAWLRRYS